MAGPHLCQWPILLLPVLSSPCCPSPWTVIMQDQRIVVYCQVDKCQHAIITRLCTPLERLSRNCSSSRGSGADSILAFSPRFQLRSSTAPALSLAVACKWHQHWAYHSCMSYPEMLHGRSVDWDTPVRPGQGINKDARASGQRLFRICLRTTAATHDATLVPAHRIKFTKDQKRISPRGSDLPTRLKSHATHAVLTTWCAFTWVGCPSSWVSSTPRHLPFPGSDFFLHDGLGKLVAGNHSSQPRSFATPGGRPGTGKPFASHDSPPSRISKL